jgi:transcriptional regulator with XRE-family HTH domain
MVKFITKEAKNMSLGLNIRKLRKNRRMSQTEVANLAGIPIPNLNEIESNRRNPSIAVLKRIANALGVTPSYLMRGE